MRNQLKQQTSKQKTVKSHSKSTVSSIADTQSDSFSTIQPGHRVLSNRRTLTTTPVHHDGTCQPINRATLNQTSEDRTSSRDQRLIGSQGQQTSMTLSFSYRVGGSLSQGDSSYVTRQSDTDLLAAVRRGQFAYIFAPRQMGKSSLRIQTRHQLETEGYQCTSIQANQLVGRAQPDSSEDNILEQQTTRLMITLWDGFVPPPDAANHKNRVTALNQELNQELNQKPSQELETKQSTGNRLHRFIQMTLAPLLQQGPLVIFIDEFDALRDTPLAAELLRWIEQCYQYRTAHADPDTRQHYQNLNFVVLGSAIAGEFAAKSTLFSAKHRIELDPFKQAEAEPLQQGFVGQLENPQALIDAVFYWTQGQPFLTQKVCYILQTLIKQLVQASNQPLVLSAKTIQHWVDETVRSQIIKDWPQQDEPVHLRAISDRITRSPNKTALKSLYKRIYAGTSVILDNSHTQAELMLSGIVTPRYNQLQIANEIYRHVFPLR